MEETVSMERRGAVTVVTIERPERRNGVDASTADQLYGAFSAFAADETASVAILQGRGGHVCGGADLKAMASGGRAIRIARTGDFGPVGPTRMRLGKPVIAAIEGYAVAGGAELALWADLRVFAEGAIFGIFCRRFGVPLVDLATVRPPRLIGQSRALDLILTGRPVGAQEALAMGLANRVAPTGAALATAYELAEQIAAFPQACMRDDRRSVLDQWAIDWDAATTNEAVLGLETLASGETAAGAARFVSGQGRHGAFQ